MDTKDFIITSSNRSLIGYSNTTTDLVIPSTFTDEDGTIYTITEIGESAFFDCDHLTSVVIPNGVTSIGDRAFFDCDGLVSVTISDTVTVIGEEAFFDCDNLETVNGITEDMTISNSAFFSCIKLNQDFMRLPELKNEKILESKAKLAEWLENHPMQYTDGKYYSVTEEKQALLNGNLASYERSKNVGLEYPLKWNSTGEECIDWSYKNLVQLSIYIAAYVAPKVSIQQTTEIAIKECKTADAVKSVIIKYD